MTKKIYILLLITVLIMSGCAKKEKMTSFIPTAAPSEDIATSITPAALEATPTTAPVHEGQTVTKYVKLSEYDDVLNIRSTPSVDSEAVGFLVHTEKVEVIDIKDGWASFEYKGKVCYVNASYLSDKIPDYLPSPTPLPSDKEHESQDSPDPNI